MDMRFSTYNADANPRFLHLLVVFSPYIHCICYSLPLPLNADDTVNACATDKQILRK